jgi:beta-glucosidase
MSNTLSPDARAAAIEQQMTDDERFLLITSFVGPNAIIPEREKRIPEGATIGAGYVPGIPRLRIPPLQMTDASLGITNPGFRPGDTATALPGSIALGASFNRELARAAGVMLGREARSKGFNVLLGGGMNLMRDPRNGRNFEYISEDVLLTAELATEAVIGTQSEGVISTVKHFSLNANEHNRHWLDAIVDPAAHRESDLLAFEMVIERAQPGSVMGAYNKVNGAYACGNDPLLNGVLKKAWRYPGFVMSDWGAVHHWDYALKGLDQESGAQFDVMLNGKEWFGEPLRRAYAEGKFPKERLSDMVRRILRSMFAMGLDQSRPQPQFDLEAHNEIALENARQGIVLLKDDGILPLSDGKQTIAVIGGYANLGVILGAGSSAVLPADGYAATIPIGGEGMMASVRNLFLFPSSPLKELKRLLPNATIHFDPAMYLSQAVHLARTADMAIVFAIRPEAEGYDAPDLSLPWGQDALIEAVADANPNTIVVLETGNPIVMPWHNKVKAIVEAWFPGQAGGTAIAEVLTGKVNPSGRLPITFPADIEQTPRPAPPGAGTPWGTNITVDYNEGADIGYTWFAKHHHRPLYPFGYGLSYTIFSYSEFEVTGGETITASFTVTNTGKREGADVPQVYLTHDPKHARLRLIGFERVSLKPGESCRVTIKADPRLLAHFNNEKDEWHLAAGTYAVALSRSATEPCATADVYLRGV